MILPDKLTKERSSRVSTKERSSDSAIGRKSSGCEADIFNCRSQFSAK
ncbi:hypothetical protein [Candidatus Galacturonibacter soehngenii]|nr:hypothetical protein [Candidatus Galacturonibacter soehngenii]